MNDLPIDAKSSTKAYSKNSFFGPVSALSRFIFELRNGRIVIASLYRKNYLNRHADTALRFVWVFITPIVPVLLYNFLQLAGLFGDPQGGIPRSVFLTYGLTLYYGFSEALVMTSGLINNNRGVIISSGTSKILLSLSELLGIFTNLLIRSVVFCLIAISVGIDIGVQGITILLSGCAMMMIGYSIGLVTSLFTVIYKDITNFINIIAFYLLFASGVFREIDADGWIWEVLRSSPLYLIIGNTRDFAFGVSVHITQFASIVGLSLFILFTLAITIFYRGERYVDKLL